jgi:hypothetical protein
VQNRLAKTLIKISWISVTSSSQEGSGKKNGID